MNKSKKNPKIEKIEKISEKANKAATKAADIVKTRVKNGKLAHYLCGVAFTTILVLMLANFFVLRHVINSDILEEAIQNYNRISGLYAIQMSNEMENIKSKLEFYTKNLSLVNSDADTIVDWLKSNTSMRDKAFDYVSYVDKDANFRSDIGTETKVSDRDYYRAIMGEGADSYIDNPTLSKLTGQLVIHVCSAAVVDGKNKGFFVGNTTPKTLQNIVENIKVGKTGHALLLSGDDSLIGTSGDKDGVESFLTSPEGAEFLKYKNENPKGGYFEFDSPENGTFMAFYSPIEGTEWTNTIIISKSEVTEVSTHVAFIQLIGIIFVIVILNIAITSLVGSVTKHLQNIGKNLENFSKGEADLTQRLILKKDLNNEIGRLVDNFNGFMAKLHAIVKTLKGIKEDLIKTDSDLGAGTQDTASAITEIIATIDSMNDAIGACNDSITQTAGAITEITANIESLDGMIMSQSASVTQAAAAVEQMIGNVNSVKNMVTRMASSFTLLEDNSSQGAQMQEEINARITGIANDSKNLQEANTVISTIAEQTNLLAMNAAIEAAHAGEAGKGFSVVADEIRKLSENSSEQSKTIGLQLQKISESIEEIVKVSNQANAVFSNLSSEAKDTGNLVVQIQNAMEEQTEGSKQISESLVSMNDNTIMVRNASKEMTTGSRAILTEIHNLQDNTLNIKKGMEEMSYGARKIDETGMALSEISRIMSEAIKKLGNEVDLFKV